MPFDLQNICFQYAAKPVIENLSITFDTGLFYGIIGPNGSGKTTLIDLMSGHAQPASGKIQYQGKTLAAYQRKDLAREIALVPQDFYINFPYSVKEVVMMGRYPYIPRFAAPSPEDIGIVNSIMADAGICDFAERYITELSGGERQRVVFARALVQDTPILLLDEATSNLDINFSINLLNLAANKIRAQRKTVFAVFQDINLAAAYCDYLVFLSGGTIVTHGPTGDVLNSDTIRTVFNIDSKVYREEYTDALQVVYKK